MTERVQRTSHGVLVGFDEETAVDLQQLELLQQRVKDRLRRREADDQVPDHERAPSRDD